MGAGTWHELSDVDPDVVLADGARVDPAAEIAALFGPRAVIVLTTADSADVVLDTREEISIRSHPVETTSPNILATVRVVSGRLSPGDLAAADRFPPDEPRLLDGIVSDAIGAQKALARGRDWEAVAAAATGPADRAHTGAQATESAPNDLLCAHCRSWTLGKPVAQNEHLFVSRSRKKR